MSCCILLDVLSGHKLYSDLNVFVYSYFKDLKLEIVFKHSIIANWGERSATEVKTSNFQFEHGACDTEKI